MMLKKLKEQVLAANLLLPKHGLVTFTWGNVSGIDREKGLVVIKPSGVEYDEMTAGRHGRGRPGHGRARGGQAQALVRHAHAPGALPRVSGPGRHRAHPQPLGHHHGAAGPRHPGPGHHARGLLLRRDPLHAQDDPAEIAGEYERETGNVIVETFQGKNPEDIPAVLVHSHGPFAWGTDPKNAVHNAVVLEEIAFMAWHDLALQPDVAAMQQELLDKHYLRKHGANAYYGQN